MTEEITHVFMEILLKLSGLSYSALGFGYLLLITTVVVSQFLRPNALSDRRLFWAFGAALLVFTGCVPPEVSRDGMAYVHDVVPNTCGVRSCDPAAHPLRDFFWYASVSILRGALGDERVVFVLASIGVLIKLLVIDQLCKWRLLALLLLIPLVYIQYDFTQLRAGFAISWFFLGIYLIARHRFVSSIPFMATSFLWHAQALPSAGIYAAYWLNRSRWVLPLVVISLLLLLMLGAYPTIGLIHSMQIGLGSESYVAAAISGQYVNVKLFPLGYLPILIYALWILVGTEGPSSLSRVVGASLGMAMFLAWLVASNPVMQGRMFEFYVAPIVLVVGNLGSNRYKIAGAVVLSWILYLRLELLHDWILG